MALVLDDERFERAKALHTERKSPSALQDLCMDFYTNEAAAFISKWKKSGENIFDLLPNNLRTDLLNYLPLKAHRKVDLDKGMRKAHFVGLLKMVMNEETVKLDIQRSDYNFPHPYLINRLDDLQRLLLADVALRSPKLQHFAIAGYRLSEDPEAENLMSPRDGLPHLLKLEDLMHLEIFGFWYWKNDDLSQLFSHLKQLVFLKILLHKNVSASGFRNIHFLKNLEEFHFLIDTHKGIDDDEAVRSSYEWIYSYCAENVSSLKLIGGTNEECVDENDGVHYFSELRQISPSIRGTSRLEFLHTKSVLPSADFPNLQNLFFQGPLSMNQQTFYGKISSFTHLSYLNLKGLNSDVIVKMLESVGKQLDTLYVSFKDRILDVFQILHLCPNLATFHRKEFYPTDSESYKVVQQSKYQALVTKHNVRLLKEFDAVLCKGEKVDGLFELVLFAPLLEHLDLANLTVTRAECQSVHEVLEGHFLHFMTLYLSGLDLDTSCALDDFGLFVQFLVCSAPCLNYTYIQWRNDYLSEKWKSEHTVAKSFLELIK